MWILLKEKLKAYLERSKIITKEYMGV